MNELLSFLEDETTQDTMHKKYKMLIIDDEPSVHKVTKLALEDFTFEDAGIEIISALSANEAKAIISETPDIAIAFIDVVMESEHAGLELVDWIRTYKKDNFMRLIIRTGQPGSAPETNVIKRYDINDYKTKTELSAQKLFTSIYGALRNYRDLLALENAKNELDELRLEQMTQRIEKALNVSYEDIIKVTPMPCALLSPFGTILTCNDSFYELTKGVSNFNDTINDLELGDIVCPIDKALSFDGFLTLRLNDEIDMEFCIKALPSGKLLVFIKK